MFGENLPAKLFSMLSLEDNTFFSCFGISFSYSLLEVCQVLSNDVFGPAGISDTPPVVFLFSSKCA